MGRDISEEASRIQAHDIWIESAPPAESRGERGTPPEFVQVLPCSEKTPCSLFRQRDSLRGADNSQKHQEDPRDSKRKARAPQPEPRAAGSRVRVLHTSRECPG